MMVSTLEKELSEAVSNQANDNDAHKTPDSVGFLSKLSSDVRLPAKLK
ncbi:hypothetical protein [Scandinavium lactucae]|uniref:Uncharacterized protein n=1 Tax=Scandinavium lactucae TaxID=3095028 RepID=A0ABU4QSJ3_9ENTR|nr:MULTISPECIES: hypothetical protein [unclassified Scandinavium]MDX6042246.1 hypothetical protein [Scandinavium sp. V105_6]MDX6052247.1 hypothetical protein [Scandinavium sp. V105_1]